jgi:arylsulfatase A-like enzyme
LRFGICSILAVFGALTTFAHASPRNVLLLLTDDQRPDTVAALGNDHIRTPNLDRLARSGMVFDNAYCMGSTMPAVCLPSRTMIMSGRSLFRLQGLTAQSPCLPRTFRQAGYVTYHYGKWGNVPVELQKNFEHNHYLDDVKDRTGGYPGKTIADHATEFLRNRDRSKPFLVVLAFANPHDERVVNDQTRSIYSAAPPPLPRNFMPLHPFDNGELLVRDEKLAPWPRTPENLREQLIDYYGVITYLDSQIGRVLDTLRQTGEYKNTIIVFTSDHGLALGSHGLMGKQNLYEHSMKAPLIIAGGGLAGVRTESLVYLHDLYPTLCELAGIQAPPDIDGRSLVATLGGESSTVRQSIFTAYGDVQRAVRDERWKLIRYPRVDKTQLFDLRQDPDEVRDLASDPRHAGEVARLMALLAQQQKLAGDTLPLKAQNPGPAEIDLSFFQSQAVE